MIQKMLAPILDNWRTLALCAAALLIAGFLFYAWSYERGVRSCEAGYATANQKAVEDAATANQSALAREIKASANRARQHTEINKAIEDSHDETADDPAPYLDQLYYDGLRGRSGQKD